MIVCLCRSVNDQEISQTMACGADTVEAVEEMCGAGGGCGACRGHIERLLRDCEAHTACQGRQRGLSVLQFAARSEP